jgi:hypothetical protein
MCEFKSFGSWLGLLHCTRIAFVKSTHCSEYTAGLSVIKYIAVLTAELAIFSDCVNVQMAARRPWGAGDMYRPVAWLWLLDENTVIGSFAWSGCCQVHWQSESIEKLLGVGIGIGGPGCSRYGRHGYCELSISCCCFADYCLARPACQGSKL